MVSTAESPAAAGGGSERLSDSLGAGDGDCDGTGDEDRGGAGGGTGSNPDAFAGSAPPDAVPPGGG